MPRVLAPFLLPGSDDPNNPENRCRLPPSQGNFWQSPAFTNFEAMAAYWRVKSWQVNITVSGPVVGSIACGASMNAGDETQLVCGKEASGFVEAEMFSPLQEITVDALLLVNVSAIGIGVLLEFRDYPEGGDSFILWDTTDSSGGNQIILTMGSITKNLVGEYFGSDAYPDVIATGTMTAVEWWSYDGLYDTSTGEPL